ncbi:MAG TPA: GNAT family N-acetyltransferase [Myxococcales bacterium]|nr:GNAT family N-acetyltransferase [Myxococcales bacterium]
MSEARVIEVLPVETTVGLPGAGEWRELNGRARAGTMFLGPEWLLPWWRHFGEGREQASICLREGGRLIGFCPLFLERVRLCGIEVRRLAFLGDGQTGCDYLDVLAEPGREREVLERCLAKLLELPWDLCDLDGLWREGFTALQLAARFSPTGDEVAREGRIRFVCPHIPLSGTWEQYLEGLGRRENLRRREKWLFRQPGVSLDCARAPEESVPAMEDFLALHRARWAVEGGSDGLSGPRHEAFHREASQELARAGMLRLYTLRAARRPVASVYGVVHGGKFNYYQSGYDPNWASRSVGLVLLARTVQDAFAGGYKEFDFLRGNEGYKGEWSRGERWTVRLRLWRGRRARAARAASGASLLLREAVKAALPGQAMAAARKLRRVLGRPPREGENRLSAALRILQER